MKANCNFVDKSVREGFGAEATRQEKAVFLSAISKRAREIYYNRELKSAFSKGEEGGGEE